jgi:hypothetical protein
LFIWLKVADDEVDSMFSLRKLCEDSGLDAYAFSFSFLFAEQFAVILNEGVSNLALALIAVSIVSYFFLLNAHATGRSDVEMVFCVRHA